MDAERRNWDAAEYARHSSAQLGWAQELIAKLALQGHEAVLDIGCGDGKITAQLAQQVPHGRAVGIDASPEMVALASRSFPPAQWPNLSFLLQDATALQLPQAFDLAFSNATLHWIRDHPAVLRGVRRCLRPGGRLLFQMGGRGNAAEMLHAMSAAMDAPSWRARFDGFLSPYHFCGVEEYEAWLPACGFRPRRIELIPKDMQHPDAEGLKGWLRTTWFPFLERVEAERREAFLEEVMARYLAAHPLDAEGRTHVGMVRLEVEAEAVKGPLSCVVMR